MYLIISLIVTFIYVISTLVQSAFYVFMMAQWSKKQTNILSRNQVTPISVIVAAHNEEENLVKLIPILLDQNHHDFEVIVAVDRSNDESLAYLTALKATDNRLNFIDIKKTPSNYSHKKYALSEAIKIAKNNLLVFTDADCTPVSQDWLSIVAASFKDKTEIAIGYSPYLKISGLLNRFIRYETLLTAIQYFTFSKAGIGYMGVGRNMAYQRDLFLKNDGYSTHRHITGGDDDLFIGRLANQHNVSTYYGNQAFVNTLPEQSWGNYFKQKRRHLSVGKHYKQSHQILLTMLGVSQIMFWLTFVILATIKINLPLLVLCFAIRILLQNAFFIKGTREIGDNFEYIWILFLDLIHTLFLIVMGPIGFFTKKVKWN